MPDSSNTGHGRDTPILISTGMAQEGAALLLIESLIHGLIARSILSIQEAVDIIDNAAEVEREIYDSRGSPAAAFRSLLGPLGRSLRVDLG